MSNSPRTISFLAAALLPAAFAAAQEKITYNDHGRPIFQASCASCHNADKNTAGLNLTSYQSAINGSSNGKVLNAGDPDGSRLYLSVTHQQEPKMPKSGSKLSDKSLETIRRWIAGGLLDPAVKNAAGDIVTPAEQPPYWVYLASYSAMAFGTAIGGWRIVKTMGMGLTHLKPVGGFCAEVAGAVTLFVATFMKIPVSTTHTITGAIVGVGSVTKARGIRWGVATRILYAWLFTIPAAGLVAAAVMVLVRAAGAF
jgi:phosphate/sulfate permease